MLSGGSPFIGKRIIFVFEGDPELENELYAAILEAYLMLKKLERETDNDLMRNIHHPV